MPSSLAKSTKDAAKHPPIQNITDTFTFQLGRLVSINERSGQQWAQKMFGISLNGGLWV